MRQNILVQSVKLLLIDLIGELLYFPIWWYTKGLKKIAFYVVESIRNSKRNLAVGLLFKNFFKPMFGQYDREGRIISLFMRFFITLFWSTLFLVSTILYILILIFWIILPVIVSWGIYNNFSTLWKA